MILTKLHRKIGIYESYRVLSVLDSTRFLKILKNTPRLRHAPHSSPNVFTLIETPRIISKDDLKDNEFPSPGDNSLPPEHVLVARGGRNYPLLLTKPRTRLVRLKHRPRRVNRKRVKKHLLQTEISKNQIESLFANKELVRGLTFSPILSPQVQFLKSQLQKLHVPEESQDTIILPREIFAGHPADDINLNTGTFSLAVGL